MLKYIIGVLTLIVLLFAYKDTTNKVTKIITKNAAKNSVDNKTDIALIVPLGGKDKEIGESAVRGAELALREIKKTELKNNSICLLYTSPSPRDRQKSRMPSSA